MEKEFANEPVYEKIFYKYKGMNDFLSYKYLKESLQEKYLYISRLNQLNDPFDSYIPENNDVSTEEIKVWMKTYTPNTIISAEQVKQEILCNNDVLANDIQRRQNESYVLSLSATEQNEMMWALYAENYSGICLGYRALYHDGLEINGENYFYIPFDYQSDYECVTGIRNVNGIGVLHLRPVHYDNEGKHKHSVFRHKETELEIDYNIYHKKECWFSEKEYRAFLAQDRDKPTFKQKIYYDDTVLAEVIFGYKTAPTKILDIVDLIKKNYSSFENIRFFRMEPDYRNFCLRKTPIKDIM